VSCRVFNNCVLGLKFVRGVGINSKIHMRFKFWVEGDGQISSRWDQGVGWQVCYTAHLVRIGFYSNLFSGFRACKGRGGRTKILRQIQNIRISAEVSNGWCNGLSRGRVDIARRQPGRSRMGMETGELLPRDTCPCSRSISGPVWRSGFSYFVAKRYRSMASLPISR
jgi:hypothetical protein